MHHNLSRNYIRQQLDSAVANLQSTSHQGNAAHVQLTLLSKAQFRQQAAQLNIQYGKVDTPFGSALLGFNQAGICHLSFHDVCDTPEIILNQRWPAIRLSPNQAMAQDYAERIFRAEKVSAWTYGAGFHIQVWHTLMQLPSGSLISYQTLATQAGAPGAARAAGSAMAQNRLAWLIPCHRVLRQSGEFGHYGGGVERKIAMVAYEAAHTPCG